MRGVTVDPAGRINLRLFKAAEVPSVDGNSQSTTDFLLISGGFASEILYGPPVLARPRNESQGPGLLNPRSGSGVCLSNAMPRASWILRNSNSDGHSQCDIIYMD
jgi:hypothetical protein